MSPVNSDDSSGDALGGAGRPLTRKEIRAREKLLATQGHNVIPPQAFETGPDVPTPATAPAQEPRRRTPDSRAHRRAEEADQAREKLPEEPGVHATAVHEEAVREEPVREEAVHEEPCTKSRARRLHAADPCPRCTSPRSTFPRRARPRRRWPRGRRLCVSGRARPRGQPRCGCP